MPKFKRFKKFNKRIFSLISLLIIVVVLTLGAYAIRQRQLIKSFAKVTEGTCVTNDDCKQYGDYKCESQTCVPRNPGPGGGGSDTTLVSNVGLDYCDKLKQDNNINVGSGLSCNRSTNLINGKRCKSASGEILSCCLSGFSIQDNKCVPSKNDENLKLCQNSADESRYNCIYADGEQGPSTGRNGSSPCWNYVTHRKMYCCPNTKLNRDGSCVDENPWQMLNPASRI